ncbi:NACHT domain-containing protein [Trichoderma breve]|uniref:NACHT domain-containing protein n=1 Tax=Trichoderma breve TaxID=2034170 RepID=A0A9W9JPV4_9HYPO|nr:NACHT domain-containing protein [Trichoderma breve]KAJ4863623.1 NACHT domain-containing protein [Trichoderma breve]
MSNIILDTGLSVVYEAENSPPVVDIVFVHGLQGHPSKTWTYQNDSHHKPVFWPADLLPNECPSSRILTFGYDSKVTNLGGIVVKEMLVRSSSSSETELKNIVESTATIVFLGTPHRGSQGVAALGEVVRSLVSSFGMETTPVILDALGLKTTDLLRAQEDFSTLWQKYDFRVKTFQEGLSLAKLKKKVVPDHSSLIGDSRERAETLQANHMEMCRYSGKDDPNYYKACLMSLWFPTINTRYQSLERPAEQTCSWLFNLDLYRDWLSGRTRQESNGLLWLKGKPGAGKSTLMKEAFRRATLEQVESNHCTAAFFFSAKGDMLEHSTHGLFQSLLYQLLSGDRKNLRYFHEFWDEKNKLKREVLLNLSKTTIIFIDALDECDESSIRSIAYFWREITNSAYERGVDLKVCLSSRHFPTITLCDCPEIVVEQHNHDDIATYVNRKFQICISTQKPKWELLIKNILSKTDGVFLWAVLVVEDPLLKSLSDWHQSDNFIENDEQLEKQIRRISRGLVEVNRVYADTRIVQVIHESVREFFLKADVDYADFHDSISDKDHRLLNERPRAKEEVISESEMLKSLVFNPSAKIVEWFAKDDGVSSAKWTSPGCSPWVSLSDLSRMSQQRILEDDPALLSYALFKLFTHALLADEQGADLRPFMERLKDGATWARWVALREDIPHGTKVSSYGLDMGLRAWKEEEERERERERHGEKNTKRGKQPLVGTFLSWTIMRTIIIVVVVVVVVQDEVGLEV